jgi:homospermidine synthase
VNKELEVNGLETAEKVVITVLGSRGGVAKALFSIWNQARVDTANPLHAVLSRADFHLVDKNQNDKTYYAANFPELCDQMTLHQFDLRNVKAFRQHLLNTQTALVVDVSWADTLDMLRCCNELGIAYVNTALENTLVDETEDLEGFTLIERYMRFEQGKQGLNNVRAIVCSGMNPGVVQWMALELMKKYPDERPKACYIVEEDRSFFADKSLAQPGTIYTTWSPECFLDEALLNFPMFMKQRIPTFLYNHVYEIECKVSLGEKQFYGCLMAHEEVLTLGERFDMEVGFLYRINEHTTQLIRNNLARVDDLWDWPQVVLSPPAAKLTGADLVGILLVYEGRERYMYNVMDNSDIVTRYNVNATYFQVACGLFAAISSLLLDDFPAGIYYVDDLLLKTESKYGSYLTYMMGEFVTGENPFTDGLLYDRMRAVKTDLT